MLLFLNIKMKVVSLFILFICCSANAQEIIYWSNFSSYGNWDWGNGCNINEGGNWYWSTSGIGNRKRPDCYASYNIIKFDNSTNSTMNLNSLDNFSANQILFVTGTPDRIINSDASRSIYFQNNNGNCKIENSASGTTHTFNVPIFINSGGNNMEINPIYGYLNFTKTITNNSTNAIAIYGNQQLTVSGDIAGIPGVTINNNSTLIYSGVSKTYSGTTTINNTSKLKISSNQTLGNIVLNGGILQVDSGVTLTITGTYSSTVGSIIDNKGTIKFAGGSVTFPGLATINNGTSNTLTSLEVASLATVILNTDIKIVGSLSVDAGGKFDNGGENQIINGGGAINISGTFITRDADGFVGTNTAIPSITPTLNIGSTVEYGLSGNQAVQGSTAPIYQNVTFSKGGTKTLISKNNAVGTITISGSTIFDASKNNFGSPTSNVVMTETSKYILGGTTASKPESGGTYSLGVNTTIEFSGSSAISVRLISPIISYANIIVSGTNVWNSGTSTGIKFQLGGTFTVKNGATFKFSNTDGFTGSTRTAINNTNSPTIVLESGSTVDYAGENQSITPFSSYSNLGISGSGIKTIPGSIEILVGNDLNVTSATLQIDSNKLLTVTNSINNTSLNTIIIKDGGNLVQLTDSDNLTNNSNVGNIKMTRTSRSMIVNDYVYWGSPVKENVLSQIPSTFDRNYSWALNGTINGTWVVPSTTIPGQGFITKVKTAGTSSFDFIGTPNNGTVKVWANSYDSVSAVFGNFILLSNPYPSAIDAAAFVANSANSGIGGTLYFWTSSTPFGGSKYDSNDYSTWNLTGGTSTAPAPSNPILSLKPTGKIAAAQGFFATIHADFDVTFTNEMRIRTGTDNSQFFKINNLAQKQQEQNRIWLNLSNSNYAFRQTLIGYVSGATNEMDRLFDGTVFTGNEINIYSVLNQKQLAVQGRALPFNFNDIVPLGFTITNSGEYKIDIDEVDGYFANLDFPIFIEDKVLNIIFDLKKGAYVFYASKGTHDDRFVLRYTNPALTNTTFEKDKNQITVFAKNKQISVNSVGDKIDKVRVYDIFGKQIYIKNDINSNNLTIGNLVSSKQVLLIKITLQNSETYSKKIMY
jgi:hypothetical protein